MTHEPQTTADEDIPSRTPPCAWCGHRRRDDTYRSDDEEPLCATCWQREYGEDDDDDE